MNDDTTASATQKRAGRLESAVLKLFTRHVRVLDIADIGGAFRIVTLAGNALQNVAWTPGDKIQIQLGGWVQRTYTPMDWDAESGRTRILVYRHSGGPGVQWARALRTGDECIVFGPRKSIRLVRPQSAVILFGDETSLGLAAALSRQVSPQALRMLFEVSAPADTMPAIEQLRLDGARICARHDNDGHLAELGAQMSALLQSCDTADIVLTGKASSIQHIGRLLRQHGIGAGRRQSKAYWAPGKTGLD